MTAAEPGTARVVLIIEYNGSAYHGSQYQANAPTIQEEIERALGKLTGKKIRIKAASRTDAGVHALGQVVSFSTDSVLPLKAYVDGINHFLPDDIAVKSHERAQDFFVNTEFRTDTAWPFRIHVKSDPSASLALGDSAAFRYQATVLAT